MATVLIERRGNRVEIRHSETDDLLAHCMIGDDEAVEQIADILSSKRLPDKAMELRRMAQDARSPLYLEKQGRKHER